MKTLAHARAVVAATDLPVAVDLEKGFGDSPAIVAETIGLAADTGIVGGSIEDATGDKTRPLFDLGQATERVGADVLFATGLPDLNAVRSVCAAVSKPVNFMAGLKGRSFTVADLESAGVRRISLGSALYRAAMTSFMSAAHEIKRQWNVRLRRSVLTITWCRVFCVRSPLWPVRLGTWPVPRQSKRGVGLGLRRLSGCRTGPGPAGHHRGTAVAALQNAQQLRRGAFGT
jgi:2-methylisocitrate lyase-like PEP mutase family enzyme